MSEQKHIDTVEEAKKLLSDGDENYKLHTVIWLYQQSEKVTKLEAERSELRNKVIDECTEIINLSTLNIDWKQQLTAKLDSLKTK